MDDLTIRRFTSSEPRPFTHIKTVSRPNKFITSLCHYPKSFNKTPFIFNNDEKKIITYEKSGDQAIVDSPVANNAWINHYYIKSPQEFIWKKARGYGDRRNAYDVMFSSSQLQKGGLESSFRYSLQFIREENYIQDARALARAPQVEREIAQMLSDPQIKAAHSAIFHSAAESMRCAVHAFKALPIEIMPDELKQTWLFAAGDI